MYIFNILLGLILFVACNGGGGSDSTGPTWAASGTLTYDFVPITSSGLNYAGTLQKPVRNVYIEARNSANDKKVASAYTDDFGAYTLNVPQSVSEFYVGVYSKLKSPSFQVEDNTNNNAVYMAASSDFTNTSDATLSNINIQSGWGGSSYSLTRASAPFAILDSLYTAYLKIHAERPSLSFPALKANWSVNNVAVSGDISTGQIGTSYYDGSELYLLGKADSDTDEFDNHVVVHEFGHYIEAQLGRSDSLGGSHSIGDLLNISLAFGEGWGNSFSAMVFDPDIYYRDSNGAQQGSIGVSLNMESSSDPNKGWFSEVSCQELIFDAYDPISGSGDNISLGIGPIMDVITGFEKTTSSLTSIFSFIHALKVNNPGLAADFDTLVATKDIDSVADEYGTGESHDAGMTLALPLYNQLTLDGAAVATELAGASGGDYNNAPNNRYYRFNAGSSKTRLSWNSSDSFYILVFKKGTSVLEGFVAYDSGNLANHQDFATNSGQEYVVQVLAFPDEMSDSSTPVNFSLSVQKL